MVFNHTIFSKELTERCDFLRTLYHKVRNNGKIEYVRYNWHKTDESRGGDWYKLDWDIMERLSEEDFTMKLLSDPNVGIYHDEN